MMMASPTTRRSSALGMIRSQSVGDPHAGVEADHGEPLVAERVHQRDEVVGLRAGVVPPCGLSESPIPRWSTAMTVKSRASAGITRRHWYQVCGQPWTSSNGGPLPPMTACRRTPLALTYRLVNVSVKPLGR